jgi:basic membrane protein A
VAVAILLATVAIAAAWGSGKQEPAKLAKQKLVVAMVTNQSGLGDQSFNDTTWAGIQKAEKELGIEKKISEAREQAQYVPNLTAFAEQKCDLVVGVGFMIQDALKEAAALYPNTHFALVDGQVDAPNVACLLFKEEEASFLVGAIAGLTTKTGAVGFVGGMSDPITNKMEVGYKAGVMTTNPGAKVLVAYAGSFADPAKGEEMATPEFQQGADIVFHAAGGTGLGVINAAKKLGKYAIGADIDQNYLAPENVLTSAMKRVDMAVYNAIKMLKDGTFKGGKYRYGIKEGGIGYAPTTAKMVPVSTIQAADKLQGMIVDGRIVVPTTYDELAKFTPPKLN